MKFYNTINTIASENRRFAIRISNLNPNEMFCISKWDFNAKSVCEYGNMGIYGMDLPLFSMGFDFFARLLIACCSNTDNIRFILLEIDKDDIVFKSMTELSFRRANMLKVFTIDEFLKFTKSCKLFDYNHISTMVQLSSAASIFFAINYKDEWVGQMIDSYKQMYSKLEKDHQNQQKMIFDAKDNNPKFWFSNLYDKLKEVQLSRKIIDSMADINLNENNIKIH